MENEKEENLNYLDFAKFDLRTGTIISVESIPKSKKLLKLEVDFGSFGKLTIVSGIGPLLDAGGSGPGTYIIEGQKVIGVLNFAPKTMFDIESSGMLLATKDENGKFWLANPGPTLDGLEVR